MNSKKSLDKDKAIKSLDKLFDIFKEISFNADEIFKSRCPYKNAKSRCAETENTTSKAATPTFAQMKIKKERFGLLEKLLPSLKKKSLKIQIS